MSNSYKLIEITKKTTGQEQQGIYDHTDETALLAALENDFGVALKVEENVAIYCIAIDNETGEKIASRYWNVLPPTKLIDDEPSSGDQPDVYIRHRVYTHNDYASDNIAPYDTDRLALANFYTKSAAAKNKAECDHAVTILIDDKGEFIEFENWYRPKE